MSADARGLARSSGLSARVAGLGLLIAMIVIHLMDLAEKLEETPYMGFMFVGLVAVASVAAFELAVGQPRRGWIIGGWVALTTLVGYSLTRTVGLPAAMEDIGNWAEPLGVASILSESALVLLATWAVTPMSRTTDARVSAASR